MMSITGSKITSDERPETIAAYLPCYGPCATYGVITATKHRFVRKDGVKADEGDRIKLWKLIFQCEECTNQRGWGNER